MATTFAKIALAGGLFLGVLAFAENRASAMPLADQSVAAVTTPAQAVEKTRWVCGPYRCWWGVPAGAGAAGAGTILGAGIGGTIGTAGSKR
jgi:hypothetical protein